MTGSTAASSSTSKYGSAFWERLWRLSGINFLVFAIVAYFLYGNQPPVGASGDALAAFYGGHKTQILIAAVVSGMAVLNLLWFVAALRATVADAGQNGWGGAVLISSAAVGALFFLLIAVAACLAYSNNTMASGLNDFAWACLVLSSFPRAMLIMSGSFGLWRAGLISNALFGACVLGIVLGVLGGTTWLSGGFWAADGAYARFVWPGIGAVWILVVSRVLLTRSPATRSAW